MFSSSIDIDQKKRSRVERLMFGDALDEEDINLLEERVSTSRIEDIMFGSSKEEERKV